MSGVDNSIALGLSNIISAANAQHIPTIALGGCSVVSSAGAFVWNTIDQKGSATRLREVGIASNRRSAYCGEYVPGPCTHRPSHHESW